MKRREAFTLVELLMVIAIIALLTGSLVSEDILLVPAGVRGRVTQILVMIAYQPA